MKRCSNACSADSPRNSSILPMTRGNNAATGPGAMSSGQRSRLNAKRSLREAGRLPSCQRPHQAKSHLLQAAERLWCGDDGNIPVHSCGDDPATVVFVQVRKDDEVDLWQRIQLQCRSGAPCRAQAITEMHSLLTLVQNVSIGEDREASIAQQDGRRADEKDAACCRVFRAAPRGAAYRMSGFLPREASCLLLNRIGLLSLSCGPNPNPLPTGGRGAEARRCTWGDRHASRRNQYWT
jgi:hypothetical protein